MGDTEAGATELRFDGLQHLLGCHQISIAHVRHSSLRVPVRLAGPPASIRSNPCGLSEDEELVVDRRVLAAGLARLLP